MRGVDFDCAFIDEAAFVNSSLLREGVFPVAMKKRSSVVMATTPSAKPSSLFMELIKAKDENNRPRMHLVRSGGICKDCLATREPWLCKHTLDEQSGWKDRDKEERLRYLYVGAGDVFAQEQMGAIIDDSVRPFLPLYVYQFQNREPFRDPVPPDCVYLTVDPASGGKCDFYIMGFYMRDNVMVVRFRFLFFSFYRRVPLCLLYKLVDSVAVSFTLPANVEMQ